MLDDARSSRPAWWAPACRRPVADLLTSFEHGNPPGPRRMWSATIEELTGKPAQSLQATTSLPTGRRSAVDGDRLRLQRKATATVSTKRKAIAPFAGGSSILGDMTLCDASPLNAIRGRTFP